MNIFDKIYNKARKSPKKIVLPEGSDCRVIEAASYAVKEKLARIVLLGKKKDILEKAKKANLNISGVEIIDPAEDATLGKYVESYTALRRHKGATIQYVRELLLRDYVYYAAMMLREERIDGFVAGACHTTSDVARAAIHCIKVVPGYSVASGSFLVEVKDRSYGEDGLFLFADCAIVPLPRPRQLADIAISSAELWSKVTGLEPRIAMLSFSTKGSSSAASVDNVRSACEIVRTKKPDLIIDGELQADSAIVPQVARIKVPHSPSAGRANILIFPNLDAGNIAYKLIQRLAQARVVGPLIQGLQRPCSDLSRGCGVQEIIDAIAVTAVRAQ